MVKDRIEEFFSRKHRENLAVVSLFIVLALVLTWPLVARIHRSIPGDTGDPCLNAWIMSWGARTTFTSPTRFFQANIMYPSRDVLAYSEHLFTMALLSAPIYALSRNPILAYNFLVLTGLVVSALGCYLLVKELTGSRWAALVSGFFFAFCSYKFSQLTHIQIMFSAFLPLAVLYQHRYLRGGRRRDLFLFGLFLLAQSLSSWHYLVFCYLVSGLMFLWWAFFSRTRADWARLGGVTVVLVAVVVLATPFAIPYLRAHARLPAFERGMREIKMFSAQFSDYFSAYEGNALYYSGFSPFRPLTTANERALFPGLAVVVLGFLGLAWTAGRGKAGMPRTEKAERYLPVFFFLLAALSLMLTLGPEIGGRRNFLYLVPYWMGILRFIRVPARFHVVFVLALAVLAGYGVALVMRAAGGYRGGRRAFRFWGAVLFAVILAENVNLPVAMAEVPTGKEVPQVYRWLADQEGARIIELPTLPWGELHRYDRQLEFYPSDPPAYSAREGLRVYYTTYHWKQTANGYSGYFPYHYNRIFYEMQGFPSARCLELLRGLGITHVIWDWGMVPAERAGEYRDRLLSLPGTALVADFGEQWVLAVGTGETASVDDLEVEAVVPSKIPPGRPFNMAISVTNTSDLPLVMSDEEMQEFRLLFLDGEGETVLESDGEYMAPFFLQGGEAQALTLRSEKAPSLPGRYTLRIVLEGGVLGDREFSHAVEVGEMPVSEEPSRVDGRVEFLGENPIVIPSADGLFSLTFRVTNTGDTYLVSARKTREEETENRKGLVYLAVKFEGEGPPWEEQRSTLPCDLAPGQTVVLPTLIRTPGAPGRYSLLVSFTNEGFRWFGEVLALDMEVGEGI